MCFCGLVAQMQSRTRHDRTSFQFKQKKRAAILSRPLCSHVHLLGAAANFTLTRITSASFAIAIRTIAAYTRAVGTCACFDSSLTAAQATRSNWLSARHCASARTTFTGVTRTSDAVTVRAFAIDTVTSGLNTGICHALAVSKVRKCNGDHNK